MTRVILKSAILLFCSVHLTWAQDLKKVYQQAVENDPTLKAAYAAYQAALTAKPQARSFLLPNANFSASTTENSQDSSLTGNRNYNSNNYTLSITQPVFRFDSYLRYRQSDAAIASAEASYAASQQELILRTAEAYFNVLAAKDNLEYARAEKLAIGRQLEQAQKRFDVGLIAITDVHEAKAAYDLAVAQEIAAENQLATSIEALSEITGQTHKDLASLGDKMALVTPEPADMTKWTAVALKQNLNLKALMAAMQIAQKNIQIERAGHLPTLDLVAARNHNNSGTSIYGKTDTDSISLQLSIPIFSGGYTTQKTKEAIFLYNQSRENLEVQRRSTIRAIRDAYRGVISGISRVKALKQAVISNASALETTKAGFEVGTRTIVDVLNAQRELFLAKRNYAQARYDYLLNTLRLKQAAGTLAPSDLAQVNKWLLQ